MAKEIKRDKRKDLFAATPPPEAKKVLFSLFASMLEMCLDFIDAVRAYFHAKARRDAYVYLPKEDYQEEMRSKRMEMILQYLDQELRWIGFVKLRNVAWR